MGQRVGAPVELGVGVALLFADERDAIGAGGGAAFDQVLQERSGAHAVTSMIVSMTGGGFTVGVVAMK